MDPTRDEVISLANLKDGAVLELFDRELENVMLNIQDPNTDPKAKREIVLKVTFKPDEERFFTRLTIGISSRLPGIKAIETSCVMGVDTRGVVEAREVIPRQKSLFEESGKIVLIKGKEV